MDVEVTCNGLLGRRHKKGKVREKRKRKDLEMRVLVMDGVLVVTDRTSPDTSRLTEPRK